MWQPLLRIGAIEVGRHVDEVLAVEEARDERVPAALEPLLAASGEGVVAHFAGHPCARAQRRRGRAS